ncbi:MAG: ATP/GTP-binding protein [Jatrophihabitantaceae bacterium]
MPRHHRRRRDGAAATDRPLTVLGERRESWRGEDYAVRAVTAHGASKVYRCPGCDQQVGLGVPHVVTWPAGDDDATDRRHWHTPCWTAREHRRPTR